MTVLASLEKYITNILIQDSHDEIEREKISFGVKIILNDFWKFIIVYLIAIWLDCFIPTLVTNLVFFILRQVCFGFHFQNNLLCLIASVVAFPFGVFYFSSMDINNNYIILLTIVSTLVLIIFSPANTTKRPVFNKEHRAFLRKKLLIRLLILWMLILLTVKIFIWPFISYGIILISISVVIQKLEGVMMK